MKKFLFLLLFLPIACVAQQQVINVGTSANDHTGDPLRAAFIKSNSNFTDLYTNKENVIDPKIATGTNTYSVTGVTGVTAYTVGIKKAISFTNGNTGAATLNMNGLGNKSLLDLAGAGLVSGAIPNGATIWVYYDGTAFRLMTGGSGGSGGGITNGGINTEILKSDGTNAVGTKVYSSASGNLTLGDATLGGGFRTITTAGNGSETLTVGVSGASGQIELVSPLTNFYSFGKTARIGIQPAVSGSSIFKSKSAGDDTFLFGASSGQSSFPNGDGVKLQAGSGYSSGNGNGGDLTLVVGQGSGTGVNGNLRILYPLANDDALTQVLVRDNATGYLKYRNSSSLGGGGGGTWGTIAGTLSSQADLNTALGLKAPLASPTFTGIPAVPTAAPGTNTTQAASTGFVNAAALPVADATHDGYLSSTKYNQYQTLFSGVDGTGNLFFRSANLADTYAPTAYLNLQSQAGAAPGNAALGWGGKRFLADGFPENATMSGYIKGDDFGTATGYTVTGLTTGYTNQSYSYFGENGIQISHVNTDPAKNYNSTFLMAGGLSIGNNVTGTPGVYSTAIGNYISATGAGSFVAGVGSAGSKPLLATGVGSINISQSTAAQTVGHGALGDNSAILGGLDGNIPSTCAGCVILGGSSIKATAGATNTTFTTNFRTIGKTYLGTIGTTPTAVLHLPAGTATAGTAPLKIEGGTLTTTPENYAIEPTSTGLYWTNGSGTRTNIAAGGGGTVSTVSVTTANGVSGSVATATTTPAITLTLGAITPTSVNGVTVSGASTPTLAVTGTTAVSGTNTGDQTMSQFTPATAQQTVNNGNNMLTWAWNSLANLSGLKLVAASTQAAGNLQKLLDVQVSGTNGNAAQTTWAGSFSNTHAGTTSTNVGIYSSASGGTTANYAAIFDQGLIGMGVTTPTEKLEVLGNVKTNHLIGKTAAPTIAANTGAGTTPTVSLTNATDISGIINVTTGTGPSASSIIVQISFNTAYGVAPNVVIQPANAATALLSGATGCYVPVANTTTALFQVTSGPTPLSASTAYAWYYHVIQ